LLPRIAIPEPHSARPDYNARALPQYVRGIESSGGIAEVVRLDLAPADIARTVAKCDAVLLPGSPADVDPQKYGAEPHPKTAADDPRRDMADELLLQDAFNLRKPILGVCYGLQSLNVWRTGTLVQHLDSRINHAAGREVLRAHAVELEPDSRLASILGSNGSPALQVNSSHHQAVAVAGSGLRVVARCPEDGVIEAVEGSAPDHFVLAVQWHPERMLDADEFAGKLFRAFLEAAR
jgi:putative glutamine amidotransferase